MQVWMALSIFRYKYPDGSTLDPFLKLIITHVQVNALRVGRHAHLLNPEEIRRRETF